MGLGLVTGRNGHLQFLITIYNLALLLFHAVCLQFTIAHTWTSWSTVFTSPLVLASNGGHSSSRFPKLSPCPSHSNSWFTVHSATAICNLSAISNTTVVCLVMPDNCIIIIQFFIIYVPSQQLHSKSKLYYNQWSASLSWCLAHDHIFHFHLSENLILQNIPIFLIISYLTGYKICA
jgi:hypothetical protein